LIAAQEKRESIEFVSHIKEKAVLRSFGVSIESEVVMMPQNQRKVVQIQRTALLMKLKERLMS